MRQARLWRRRRRAVASTTPCTAAVVLCRAAVDPAAWAVDLTFAGVNNDGWTFGYVSPWGSALRAAAPCERSERGRTSVPRPFATAELLSGVLRRSDFGYLVKCVGQKTPLSKAKQVRRRRWVRRPS